MLADAIHDLRERMSRTSLEQHDVHDMMLQLRIFELEARNMEGRLVVATRRPHVPLDGKLVAPPIFDFGGSDDL